MGVVLIKSDYSLLNDKMLATVKCTACGKFWYKYVSKLTDIEKIKCDCRKADKAEYNVVEHLEDVEDTSNDDNKLSKNIKRLYTIYERLVRKYGIERVSWKSAEEFMGWALASGYRSWKNIKVSEKVKSNTEIADANNCKWVPSNYGLRGKGITEPSQLLRVAAGSIYEAEQLIDDACEMYSSFSKDDELYDLSNKVSEVVSELKISIDKTLSKLDNLVE